jgi:hypothetical protein
MELQAEEGARSEAIAELLDRSKIRRTEVPRKVFVGVPEKKERDDVYKEWKEAVLFMQDRYGKRFLALQMEMSPARPLFFYL